VSFLETVSARRNHLLFAHIPLALGSRLPDLARLPYVQAQYHDFFLSYIKLTGAPQDPVILPRWPQ
jgi:hypothetical protein